MSARTEIPTAHQKVCAKAAASGSASALAQLLRQALERARRGRRALADLGRRELVLDLALQHDREHAVPIEPPIRCSAFSELVARGTSARSSVA